MIEPGGERRWAPDPAWLFPSAGQDSSSVGALFLVLVTALAALVRLFHLGHEPLWVDEIITWRAVQPGVGLNFWEQIRDHIQGPLLLAVLWPLLRIQSSEFLMRLPSAIAGVLAVPILAVVAGRILGSRTARLGALLLALSPFHLWYSQEARGYALVILFSLAASLVFWLMATRGPGPGKAGLYALFSAAAVWSNMSALFLWAAHLVTLVLLVRPRGRHDLTLWSLAMFGAVAAGLPWLLKASGIWAFGRLVPGAATGVALRGETTFTPMAFPFTGFSFLYGYSLGPSLAQLHQPDRMAVIKQQLPVLALGGVLGGVILLAGIARLRRLQWSVMIWITVAFLALSLLAWRNVKSFNPRYLAVAFPWVLVVVAHGLSGLPRRLSQIATVAVLALFLWSVGQYFFASRYAKEDLRGAAQWVSENEQAGETILVPVVTQVFEYYYRGEGQVLDSYNEGVLRSEDSIREFVRRKLAGADTVWVVLARSWYLDPQDWIPRVLAGEGEVLLEKSFNGTRLFHWRRTEVEGTPNAG